MSETVVTCESVDMGTNLEDGSTSAEYLMLSMRDTMSHLKRRLPDPFVMDHDVFDELNSYVWFLSDRHYSAAEWDRLHFYLDVWKKLKGIAEIECINAIEREREAAWSKVLGVCRKKLKFLKCVRVAQGHAFRAGYKRCIEHMESGGDQPPVPNPLEI